MKLIIAALLAATAMTARDRRVGWPDAPSPTSSLLNPSPSSRLPLGVTQPKDLKLMKIVLAALIAASTMAVMAPAASAQPWHHHWHHHCFWRHHHRFCR